MNTSTPLGSVPGNVGKLRNQPTNLNQALASHFQFQMGRLPNTIYFCQEVNIPGVAISAIHQPTIVNPVMRPGGAIKHDELVVKFAVDEDYKNWQEIFKWIRECSNYIDGNEYTEPPLHLDCSASIMLLTSANNANLKLEFDGLFPTRLNGMEMNSTVPDATMLYAQASFAFSSMKFVDL
jgi:hypothetical protein